MPNRLVCTASRSRRHACGDQCDGCTSLKPDRRISHSSSIRNAISDRRTMSHVLPIGGLALAGAGGSIISEPALQKRASRGWLSRPWPLILLALLIAFNLLDVALTARALSLGVAEANPLMAGLFNASLPMGMFIKFVAVSAGAALLWKYRHLSVAAAGTKILTGCYGAVVVYHLAFQLTTL